MICIQNVSKRFKVQTVLTEVCAQFQQGEISGIVGRNGSGKSVLLKCIIGLMKPEQGEIVVDGKRIGKDVEFAEDVGFIIDRVGFLDYLSGLRNLEYLASIRGKIGKEQIRSAMEMVGLSPDDRKHVGKYSTGMKQRLGIAQVLMENPSVLIFDEPMNALDNKTVREMKAIFTGLRARGKTLVMTSHDTRDIDELCDTVCEMDAGKLTRVR